MSSAILGRSAPVAHVSRGALAHNASQARGRGIRHHSAELLDADAWGHGAALVGEMLAAQGFTVADEDAGRTLLTADDLFGLPDAVPGALPALRLTGTVLSVKELRAGEGVSYGYAFRAPDDTRVALVTGGYAQGIVRALGNEADVSLSGVRHRIVGRVAMDVCVVDVPDADVRRGDVALFLGDAAAGEPALADWVRITGWTAGELITAVGLRAVREETE